MANILAISLAITTHFKFLTLPVGRIIVLRIATAGGFLTGGRGTHFLANLQSVGSVRPPRLTIFGDWPLHA